MVKIVDAFIFYNELDMLEFRLTELYPVVDHFVLVEAAKTFAGNDKPLFFSENMARFEKFMDKITVITVTDMPIDCNAWGREYHQRNSIAKGVELLNLQDCDLIIVSDADEIPNIEILCQLKEIGLSDPISLEQDMFYYNLSSIGHSKWTLSKIIPFKNFRIRTPENHRQTQYRLVKNGGWHFSYFGSSDFIKNKIQQFSHQELNNSAYTDTSSIQEKIDKRLDLFNRGSGFNFNYIDPTTNTFLPKNYKMLLHF